MRNVIDNVRVSNAFSHITNIHSEGDKNPVLKKGSYDKQNLTLVVISYEFLKLAESSFHKFQIK